MAAVAGAPDVLRGYLPAGRGAELRGPTWHAVVGSGVIAALCTVRGADLPAQRHRTSRNPHRLDLSLPRGNICGGRVLRIGVRIVEGEAFQQDGVGVAAVDRRRRSFLRTSEHLVSAIHSRSS